MVFAYWFDPDGTKRYVLIKEGDEWVKMKFKNSEDAEWFLRNNAHYKDSDFKALNIQYESADDDGLKKVEEKLNEIGKKIDEEELCEKLKSLEESIVMITDYLETKFGYDICEQTERLKEAKDENIIFDILTHVSFKSYEKAKRFYDKMVELGTNGPVTLEDFFRYAKIEKPNLYFKWGWYNISITTIYEDPDHDGEFLLFVPRPERLDR